MEELIDIIHYKIKILKIEQEAQIHDNRCNQEEFAMHSVMAAADIICTDIVDQYRQNHNSQIARLSPSIKQDAGNKQNIVLQFFARQ